MCIIQIYLDIKKLIKRVSLLISFPGVLYKEQRLSSQHRVSGAFVTYILQAGTNQAVTGPT